MLAEKIKLKSHSHSHHERGNFLPSPFVFTAPFNKLKPQERVGIYECYFCKEKGHWKAQCPKLLKLGRKNFKTPMSHVIVDAPFTISPSGHGIGHVYPSKTPLQVSGLVEQF